MKPYSRHGDSDDITPEDRERYRRMTNEERFKVTVEMTERHLAALRAGPPEEMTTFFDELRREHSERNQLIREHFARLASIDS